MINLFAAPSAPDHSRLIANYNDAHAAYTKHQDGDSLAAKYEALDALYAAGIDQHGNALVQPTRTDYNELRERAETLELAADWIDSRLQQLGVDPATLQGFDHRVYAKLLSRLEEVEMSYIKDEKTNTKKAGKRLRKAELKGKPLNKEPENYAGPVAPPNMVAIDVKDGTYVHASNIEATGDEATYEDYWLVAQWGESMGVCRAETAQIWGFMGGPKEYSKTKLTELQKHVAEAAKKKKENKPVVNLFAVNTDTGEVGATTQPDPPQAVELFGKTPEQNHEDFQRRMEERRARISALGFNPNMQIKTRQDAEDVLRTRTAISNELAYIMIQYEEIKPGLEAAIQEIDQLFGSELEMWLEMNPPADGKKTFKTLFGEIGWRNTPESVSLDEESDPDRSRLRGWLATQTDNIKNVCKVEKVETIAFNLDALKAFYLAAIHKAQQDGKPIPVIPGLGYKPAQPNKFRIGPSLDTIKTKIRDRIKAAKENQ
jgi:hypothetical protein